jgi:glycosyltransferase involved in cell wall biosynthesis
MSRHLEDPASVRIVAASLGRHYSGINASMLAVIPEQLKHERIAALGYNIPDEIPKLRWKDLLKLRHDSWRVWHARRNMDMLAGLVLRYLFGFRFKLVFTSAAQRRHTWITRFCYKRMDAVIATTARAAEFLDCPAIVVGHGVDTARFRPPVDRAKAWEETGLPGKYGIGVFGRIRPNKGSEDFTDALLSVLPKRPDWTAVFVGLAAAEHKAFEQRLKNKLAEAGLAQRAHFAGFVPNDEIPRWYQAMSAVVCPSRVEGFGLPCLEAMASGCPVVATRTGAWPEIIQEGVTGKLVDCKDVAGLTAALLAITEDTERVSRMGQQARRHAQEHFSIAEEAKGIQNVYDLVLGSADPIFR